MTVKKGMERIPGPKPLPVVGNLFDLDLEKGLASVVKISERYGPLFQITINGEKQIFACSRELVDELCDETRFQKAVITGIENLRMLANDGLFTAYHGEHRWGVAHRILVPAFGPLRIREMFDDMSDVAEQLCLKWARHGSSTSINITDDFTRLTLDTIALCTMGFRLNNFYNNESMHPFVESMLYVLREADLQSFLPGIAKSMRVQVQRRMFKHIEVMRTMAREIIQERRNQPEKVDDLLNTMLNGRDPVTGEGMTDESIIDNVITFLVAGHENTSGLLSFTFYYLLRNPHTMERARKEVDEVAGVGELTVQHLGKLQYIDAVLKESLRMMPTAPGFTVSPQKQEVLGGKWVINPGHAINLLLPVCLRDASVFGPDADEFRPERMLEENFSKLSPNSWKPFGNGERSCIGRAFAWQEAQLVVAKVLQTFDLVIDDPNYELQIKETLTIKPDGFRVRATLRHGKNATKLSRRSMLAGSISAPTSVTSAGQWDEGQKPVGGQKISFFYGSNSGTCKALAHRLASSLMTRGFTDQKLAPLDAAVNRLPKDQPVVIVTTSYDGQPTDDAKEFMKWLESAQPTDLEGVSYAVFGCGHHDWVKTFYRIPILINELMRKAGATRLAPPGTANAAVSDLFSDLELWEESYLLPAFRESFPAPKSSDTDLFYPHQLEVSLSKPKRVGMHQGLIEATVTAARVLTSPGTSEKRHLEFSIKDEPTTWRPGDHLNILPVNPPSAVARVLAHFHLAPDSSITINSFNSHGLPNATPVSAAELFSSYVELSQPATRNNLKALAAATESEADKQELIRFHDSYKPLIRDRRLSVLDLLEKFPSISLPIATFLFMLPPLRVRTYSVSAAPSFKPAHGSLTFSVIDEPAWSGDKDNNSSSSNARYLGVGSNYLASLTPGSILYLSWRPAKDTFHLPADQSRTPIIMICAGSGLAPFRSFMQERMMLRKEGDEELAKALLFFGCRGPNLDDLYKEEIDEFEAAGVVQAFRAYSRFPDHDAARDCRYVQHGLTKESKLIWDLWENNATIYVCGSGSLASGVKTTLEEMLGFLTPERYVTEIF